MTVVSQKGTCKKITILEIRNEIDEYKNFQKSLKSYNNFIIPNYFRNNNIFSIFNYFDIFFFLNNV